MSGSARVCVCHKIAKLFGVCRYCRFPADLLFDVVCLRVCVCARVRAYCVRNLRYLLVQMECARGRCVVFFPGTNITHARSVNYVRSRNMSFAMGPLTAHTPAQIRHTQNGTQFASLYIFLEFVNNIFGLTHFTIF